jgi:N-acetyl-alpha-D-muramate 1-phosphate uridylyltransferase
MPVFRNVGRFVASNVEFDGHRILRYDKGGKTLGMKYIDYGLGVLTERAFARYPENQSLDLAVVYQDLLAGNELAAFEVLERFYEIGSPQGILDTERHLRERRTGR